jgi:hypothetical protein
MMTVCIMKARQTYTHFYILDEMKEEQPSLAVAKPAKKPAYSPRRSGEQRRRPRPAGDATPIVATKTVQLATSAILSDMPGCQLSDAAVTLITLRCNTQQSVTSLARQLKMPRHQAYNILASPTGQELMARLARSMLGYASTTGLRTLEQLCSHRDPHVALEAARDLMERAGLGMSQRAAPQATNSFAFAFGTPAKDEAK